MATTNNAWVIDNLDQMEIAAHFAHVIYGDENLPSNYSFGTIFYAVDNFTDYLSSIGWTALTDPVNDFASTIPSASFDYRLFQGVYQAEYEGAFGAMYYDAEGMVAEKETDGHKVVSLTFRGTDNVYSAITGQATSADGLNHYYDSFRPLISAVLDYVNDPANEVDELIVGGHSLGGAMVDLFIVNHVSQVSDAVKHTEVAIASPGLHEDIGISNSLPMENYIQINNTQDLVPYPDSVTANAVAGKLGDNRHLSGWTMDFSLRNLEAEADYSLNAMGNEHSSKLYWQNIKALAEDPLRNVEQGTVPTVYDYIIFGNSTDGDGDNVEGFDNSGSDSDDPSPHDRGSNALLGNSGRDYILGLTGDDEIRGYDAGDRLSGHSGRDSIYGGQGSDLIDGGQGSDSLHGGEGADTIWGRGDHDIIRGETGHDYIYAGTGQDSVYGGEYNDRIFGGRGHDFIHADSGDDQITGASGDDTLYGRTGQDTIWAGLGDDSIMGNESDDELYGGTDNDMIYGGDGDDLMFGDAGTDTLAGGAHSDELSGGSGDDVLTGDSGMDTLSGDSGHDDMSGGTDNDILYGGIGTDTLRGNRGEDRIYGGSGDDQIRGQSHADTAYGGAGNDNMKGGGGNDTLVGGNGHDFVKGGTRRDEAIGGNGNDRLFGNSFDDTLDGGNGRDRLNGGGGADEMTGGAGDDTMKGGDGADTFIFNTGHDSDRIMDFDVAQDTLLFSADLADGQSASQIVSSSTFGADGLVIDFGAGDLILLYGVDSKTGLAAAIDII